MGKAPEIRAVQEIMAQLTFGRSLSDSQLTATCVMCGESAGTFRDARSEREYDISGLCQKCQDKVFGA
jgi:hypothetical protein